MFRKYLFLITFLITATISFSQEKEVVPPYYIKTVSFVQNGQNAVPLFLLGDTFQLQFDDLHGTEDNYYYKSVYHDTKPLTIMHSKFTHTINLQFQINKPI